MASPTPLSSSQLRMLVELFKARRELTAELAGIDERVVAIWENRDKSSGKKPKKSARGIGQQLGINTLGNPSVPSLSPRSGRRHGALKAAVLKALKKAGKRGRTIGELAEDIGVLKANLHVWFSTTGKRIAGLEKIGTARWRYPA